MGDRCNVISKSIIVFCKHLTENLWVEVYQLPLAMGGGGSLVLSIRTK